MSGFEFRVLGPLEVCVGGRVHPLGRRRLKELLLALLVDPGATVSVERLMAALWEDAAPASGKAAVHNLVAALRRWLNAAAPAGTRPLLSTESVGYALRVRPDQVDAHQFEALRAHGAAALQAGDADEAAARFAAALALWRGDPFEDVAGKAFAQAPAARLEELRRLVEEDLADADLRRDRPEEAASRLEVLVADEPLRERRWELYLLALYRAGRQRDALAAYDRVRAHLRDELGADPGPRLRSLHEAVLRHEPSLHAHGGPETGRRGRRDLRPLPAPVSSLIGRREEVVAVGRLLGQGRLVTLTGPGGVGKTRVAVAAARSLAERYPGGVAFVPLGPLRDVSAVLRTIAGGLGLRDELPVVTPETITRQLDAGPVLVVLDTLEHLPGASAAVGALLESSETLSVLATSRSPLRLSGERRYPVGALPVPEADAGDPEEIVANPAVALFVERARAHDPSFALDASNAPTVVAWCRRLGGLPLAIELAAARVAEAGGALDGPLPDLDDLSTSPVDVPPRQRSLRATLDWSVSRLSEDGRRLFRRLSVFRGMPDLAAVAAVGGELAPVLDELVRASLAIPETDGGVRRITMLDMVCAYAREQLPDEEGEQARRRHGEHYLRAAEQACAAAALRPSGGASLDVLDPDANDLLIALQYLREAGAYDHAARLAVALSGWWLGRGDVGSGLRETEAVLEAAGDRLPAHLDAELRARVDLFAAAQAREGDAGRAERPDGRPGRRPGTAGHEPRRATPGGRGRARSLSADAGDVQAGGMDDRAIARWRTRTLRLSGPGHRSAEDVVEALLAVQAENLPQASWAVATRTTGVTEREFRRRLDDGAILRTHLLRPTWHFVRPDDIRWLVEFTAPRIRRVLDTLRRDSGIDEATLDAALELLASALAGGVHLTRDAIAARLADAGLPADGPQVGVILSQAEQAGLVCSGAMQGQRHTYALLEERAPRARRLDAEEALAEVVLRYFRGHGPATERDLAYWATMTLTEVRRGLALVGDLLDQVEHDGRTYWFAEPPPADGPLEPRAHLLQTLDEFHNGYQDSRGVLDAAGIAPRGRRPSMGMVLLDAQMVGDMRRRVHGDTVTFEIACYRDLDRGETAALHAAAERYGRFLEREAAVVTTPAR